MPTSNQLRQNTPLTDFTVGLMQDDANFILRQSGAPLVVTRPEDTYYTYPAGDWNRREMRLRGPSQESAGSGWTLSTDSYKCERFAVHKDFDITDASSTDPAIDLDMDAAAWIENQVRMQGDFLYNEAVMQPAVWSTDVDGVSSGASAGTSVLHWSDSSSDPQKDVQYLINQIRTLSGKVANFISCGSDVFSELLTNTAVREAIKYTEPTLINIVAGKLAAYLGVNKLLVGAASQNTAKEGQTATLSEIINPKDFFVGYVDPAATKRSYSAFKHFAWRGTEGQNVEGVTMRNFPLIERTSTRYEGELYWDVKVVAPDAAAFIDGAVA